MCKLFSETHYRNFLQTHKILIVAKYVRFGEIRPFQGCRKRVGGKGVAYFLILADQLFLGISTRGGQIMPLPPILLLAPPPQIFRPSDIAPLKGPETRLKMAPRASSPNFARLLLSRNTRASTIHVARLEKKSPAHKIIKYFLQEKYRFSVLCSTDHQKAPTKEKNFGLLSAPTLGSCLVLK